MTERPVTGRIDRDALREMWTRGLNDTEMAERLGASVWTVGAVRRQMGLPSRHAHQTAHAIDKEEFLKYYNLGFTDGQIAELMGKTTQSIWRLRSRMGLMYNAKGEKK